MTNRSTIANCLSSARSEHEANILRLLRVLARSGVDVVLEPDGSAELQGPAPVLKAPWRCPAQIWNQAVMNGWVVKAGGSAAWQISANGRLSLRRLMSGAGPADSGRSKARTRMRSSMPAVQPAINPQESPLAWLRQRRDRDGSLMISDVEFAAGERLRADFHFAHLEPRVTANWSGVAADAGARRGVPGAGIDIQDHVIAANERVHRALKAVGPELSGILIDVCCHLKGLSDAERAHRWPQRSAKIILQLALQALARHYGLDRAERVARKPERNPIRHWGADGYRPTLDAWGENEGP